MESKCKVIGAVAFPLKESFKVVKSYKKSLKTKLGPLLFKAYVAKSIQK